MNPARLGFLVLVPGVALVHGFGQYFARNMWFVALSESGGDYDVLKVAEVAATVGAVVAALVGVLGGGPACLALGLFSCAAGQFLIAADWFAPGCVAVGVGRTLALVGSTSCALRAFDSRQDSGRMALLMGVYALTNLSAVAANAGAGLLREFIGARSVIAVGGAIELLAAVLSIPLLVLALQRPADLGGGGKPHFGLIGIAAAVSIVGGLAAGLFWLATDFAYGSVREDILTSSWLYLLNPAGAVLGCLLSGGLLAALSFSGRQVPPLPVAALGFVFGGLLLLPMALPSEMLGAFVIGPIFFVSGFAEPLLFGGVIAAMGVGVHWRVVPVLVAIYSGLQTAPGWMVRNTLELVGISSPGGFAAALGGAVVLVVGLAMLAASVPLSRLRARLEGEDGEAPPPADALDPYGFPAGPPATS